MQAFELINWHLKTVWQVAELCISAMFLSLFRTSHIPLFPAVLTTLRQ